MAAAAAKAAPGLRAVTRIDFFYDVARYTAGSTAASSTYCCRLIHVMSVHVHLPQQQ